MKLLIDTNVVLDVLLKREPFYEMGVRILKLSAKDDVSEFVSASAITDIYYISYKLLKDKGAVRELIRNLLKIVSVAAVSEDEIYEALQLEWADFEDSVQYSVALHGHMDGIVTRNSGDYNMSGIKVWTPERILEQIEAKG